MKNLKKTLLVCGLLSVAVGVFAQDEAKTLPVLREGKEDIHIWVDGRLQPGAWLADPRTRPDVYPASGRRVKFANERDSVVFDVEKDGAYDFVVLTAEGGLRVHARSVGVGEPFGGAFCRDVEERG